MRYDLVVTVNRHFISSFFFFSFFQRSLDFLVYFMQLSHDKSITMDAALLLYIWQSFVFVCVCFF